MPELSAAPSLTPLFLRSFAATLPGPLPRLLLGVRRASTLPERSYTLLDQMIDPEHLRDYQQVCGFRTTDVLPATYLHVLAFPLSVKLMVEPDFPFALPGLVHVENTLTRYRPVTAGEKVSLEVHAADLRDHPAGRQVDLVATATVDGTTVWDSRSTYLHRSASPAGDKAPRPSADVPTPTTVIRVPGDTGRRYASVSGDRNPIHLYPLTARAFGFPKAIAHGMWLTARVLAALEGRLGDAFTVGVAFKTPVLLPSTVALSTTHTDGWTLDVRNARSGKPHLTGTII